MSLHPPITAERVAADSSGFLDEAMIGMQFAHVPDLWEFPPGTVWACDDCGAVWRARRVEIRGWGGGQLAWDRLGRFALWRLRRRGGGEST